MPTSPATPAELRRLAEELRQYQHVGADALTAVPTDSSATGMTGTVHIWPAANDTAISRAAAALSAAADHTEQLLAVREAAQALDDWFAEQGSQADLFGLFMRLHAALAAASDARAGDGGS